jgi:hypothetical protein
MPTTPFSNGVPIACIETHLALLASKRVDRGNRHGGIAWLLHAQFTKPDFSMNANVAVSHYHRKTEVSLLVSVDTSCGHERCWCERRRNSGSSSLHERPLPNRIYYCGTYPAGQWDEPVFQFLSSHTRPKRTGKNGKEGLPESIEDTIEYMAPIYEVLIT